MSEFLKPILDTQETADLLHCSVRSVENHARSGRLPGVKFGEGWIFSSELIVETVKKLSLEEAEKRSKPVKPFGVFVGTPKRKRKLPGMGHLTDEEIELVLAGKLKLWDTLSAR
jgi:hypothetical protein